MSTKANFTLIGGIPVNQPQRYKINLLRYKIHRGRGEWKIKVKISIRAHRQHENEYL